MVLLSLVPQLRGDDAAGRRRVRRQIEVFLQYWLNMRFCFLRGFVAVGAGFDFGQYWIRIDALAGDGFIFTTIFELETGM